MYLWSNFINGSAFCIATNNNVLGITNSIIRIEHGKKADFTSPVFKVDIFWYNKF